MGSAVIANHESERRMKKEEKATAIAELNEKFSRAKLAVMT